MHESILRTPDKNRFFSGDVLMAFSGSVFVATPPLFTVPAPPPAAFRRAADIYMRLAYPDGGIPAAVARRLEVLGTTDNPRFYASDALERDDPTVPARFCLRLGNAFYPHMKLCLDRRPDGKGFVFRADTHDRHCCPSRDSREYSPFCELMKRNQQLAQRIETAWTEAGLQTFKSYLRDDLARRRG